MTIEDFLEMQLRKLYVSTANELIIDLSDDFVLKACKEIYFLFRRSGHINGNKPL